DSLFKQRIHTGVIHRPRYLVGAGTALVSLFPHTCEGAERRKTLRLSLHLAVPRALRARRLAALHLWRLPPRDRLVRSEPETFISVIRAAFAALHPDRTGLLSKAALRFKGGREPRATRTSCVRNTGGAGATPAPPLRRLMIAPSREQASRQYRGLGTAQD